MRISLEEAAALLKTGEIVAVPTETVYGLAASLERPDAIAKVFTSKGRPSNNPLIIHVATIEQITDYVDNFPPFTKELAQAFWPGPLTLVLPIIEKQIPSQARAGLPTAAFRVPNHPLAQALLIKTGPLVMPSANKSGRPSATQASHVEDDFGSHFPILDGGPCTRGLESTILIYTNKWVIIRQGSLPAQAFQEILGYIPTIQMAENSHTPLCPGQLFRHYAPQASLSLSPKLQQEDAVLGFSDRNYPKPLITLGPSNDPETVAHHFYSALREIDIQGYQTVWVDTDFPRTGLWLTLLERLQKASQKS